MSREVRRVPRDYQHPRESNRVHNRIEFIPLYPGEDFVSLMADFKANPGDWDGRAPQLAEYMPDFTGRDDLWYCMYENTSEGTPISPVLPTPESLARWLADTGTSTFGDSTATYDQWLHTCQGGWAPSMTYTPEDGLRSGVEAIADEATR